VWSSSNPQFPKSSASAFFLAGADLVIVPQAGSVGEWPEGLYEAEMRVAAFQNGYYVALCNRVAGRSCTPNGAR
jgi:predicted amidohydrolase